MELLAASLICLVFFIVLIPREVWAIITYIGSNLPSLGSLHGYCSYCGQQVFNACVSNLSEYNRGNERDSARGKEGALYVVWSQSYQWQKQAEERSCLSVLVSEVEEVPWQRASVQSHISRDALPILYGTHYS